MLADLRATWRLLSSGLKILTIKAVCMKPFAAKVCVLSCSIFVVLPCLAQANPWNGSWKMDPGSQKYDGPSFTMATDAEG